MYDTTLLWENVKDDTRIKIIIAATTYQDLSMYRNYSNTLLVLTNFTS